MFTLCKCMFINMQQSKTMTNTVPNICPLDIAVESLFACGVVLVSPLQAIQCGLSLARGRRALSISCMLGQQGVFKPQRTAAVTQFTSTVNANNFGLVERIIWQGFEAELATHKTLFFVHFCSRRFVSAGHSQHYYCSQRLLISQTTGRPEGHNHRMCMC